MLRRQPRSTRTYTLLPNTMLFRSPIQTPLGVVHFLISHPTPPVFDGAENRNGLRNHDEIRLWAEYLSGAAIDWLYDDSGRRGGLAPDAAFVLAGDLTADPVDGDGYQHPVRLLLDHPRINAAFVPTSTGDRKSPRLNSSP